MLWAAASFRSSHPLRAVVGSHACGAAGSWFGAARAVVKPPHGAPVHEKCALPSIAPCACCSVDSLAGPRRTGQGACSYRDCVLCPALCLPGVSAAPGQVHCRQHGRTCCRNFTTTRILLFAHRAPSVLTVVLSDRAAQTPALVTVVDKVGGVDRLVEVLWEIVSKGQWHNEALIVGNLVKCIIACTRHGACLQGWLCLPSSLSHRVCRAMPCQVGRGGCHPASGRGGERWRRVQGSDGVGGTFAEGCAKERGHCAGTDGGTSAGTQSTPLSALTTPQCFFTRAPASTGEATHGRATSHEDLDTTSRRDRVRNARQHAYHL